MLDNSIELYTEEEFAELVEVDIKELRNWGVTGALKPFVILECGTVTYTNKQLFKARLMSLVGRRGSVGQIFESICAALADLKGKFIIEDSISLENALCISVIGEEEHLQLYYKKLDLEDLEECEFDENVYLCSEYLQLTDVVEQ